MIEAPRPKAVDDFLALPDRVEVSHDEEDGYFAQVVELPGCMCMTWTKRAEELWPMGEDAKRAWITVALEHGDPVPVPQAEASDVVPIQMPEELQRKLRHRATQDGVTLDQLVTRTPAHAVGE